jgi:hypothetical protein
MMDAQSPRLKEKHNSVKIPQAGWELCALILTTWNNRKFGEIIPKTQVPAGRNVIGACWVLARKDDGRYRARCIANGFSQIPEKDFQENHAPVISDTTLHLLIVIKTVLQLEDGQLDIETAFLYGKLEEDLWMVIPDGYQDYVKEKFNENIGPKTHCLKLTRAIYGLVQAARKWWKIFKDALSFIGYFPSRADPCLFIRKAFGQKS